VALPLHLGPLERACSTAEIVVQAWKFTDRRGGLMFPIRSLVVAASAAIAVQFLPSVAAASTSERLAAATEAVRNLSGTPDRDIPEDLLQKAQCIVVVPSMKSGAFVVGGDYGRGFASCRTAHGWSAPAGIKIEGGSVGFQIGGTASEVVMLVMNKEGMDRLLSTKFTLGGEAKVAAGPVGRRGTAQTDAAMTAEILSYSRSKGVFAGVALNGASLREDEDANKDLYGKKEISNRAILTGDVPPPAGAGPFLAAVKHF
jgi:lipid-binding SYLF domain-containing protein